MLINSILNLRVIGQFQSSIANFSFYYLRHCSFTLIYTYNVTMQLKNEALNEIQILGNVNSQYAFVD